MPRPFVGAKGGESPLWFRRTLLLFLILIRRAAWRRCFRKDVLSSVDQRAHWAARRASSYALQTDLRLSQWCSYETGEGG
jgi:hypothetical protein